MLVPIGVSYLRPSLHDDALNLLSVYGGLLQFEICFYLVGFSILIDCETVLVLLVAKRGGWMVSVISLQTFGMSGIICKVFVRFVLLNVNRFEVHGGRILCVVLS